MRLCTKKEYRKEEIGEKVSYFKLLTEEGLRKLWIHAIKYISVHFQRVWKRMTVDNELSSKLVMVSLPFTY